MYGHYGKVLQLLSQTSFTVADIVMAMVGLSMVAKTLEVERKGVAQTLPFAVTIGLTVLTTNIGIGVAAGCVANALILLRAPKRKNSGDTGLVARLGGIPTAILSIISLAVLVLTFVS
jgi:xanthine/uracil/vitamin C permease (AzgA family)